MSHYIVSVEVFWNEYVSFANAFNEQVRGFYLYYISVECFAQHYNTVSQWKFETWRKLQLMNNIKSCFVDR